MGTLQRIYSIITPKKSYYANYDFISKTQYDLDATAGDKLLIIKKYGNWYKAKNERTNTFGLIPKTFVVSKTSLDRNSWYFGSITRVEAEAILINTSPGTFLVRESLNQLHKFALSISSGDKVMHYKIFENDKERYFISQQVTFINLEELIDKYLEFQLGLEQRLITPCQKSSPEIYETSGKYRNNYKIERKDLVFDEDDFIASGNFGKVFKGTCNGHEVAIKKLKENLEEDFEKEVKPLKLLQHRNVITLFGICKESGEQLMIFEFLSNGSVEEYIKKHDLETNKLTSITLQVCDGMKYIHSKNIVHRDLAARNVLLTKKLTPKISDFGLARLKNHYSCYQGNSPTACRWNAVEVLLKKMFNEKTDVWSFGIFIIELFTKASLPYFNLNNDQVLKFVLGGNRLGKPATMPKEIFKIAQKCWYTNPESRPNFEHLYQEIKTFCM